MLKATKTTMIAGAAVVALVGIGGGVAFATSGGSPIPSSTLTAATVSTAPTSGPNTPKDGPDGHRHRGLLARAEHGSVTVRTKTGTEVIDVQRGQVTAVSPTSITVRSQDGFSATYVVDSTTKVRRTGQQSAIGSVANGDNVVIAAVHSGTTDTAKRIGDHGTKAPGTSTPTTPSTPTTTH